jgi:alanine racemase
MEKMPRKFMQWVEIDRSALTSNIRQFRSLIGDKISLLAVVKANAYGHGILKVSRIALEAGVDWLGVHSLEEGLLLRREGLDCPLLILGYVSLEELEEAVARGLRLTVYNLDTIHLLDKISCRLKKKVFIHLKIETGTYRQGIDEEDVFPFLKKIQKFPYLVIEGLSSHFANIEDTTDHSYPRLQLKRFKSIIQKLKKHKIEIPIKHLACTAATILFPETYFDMVRVGIGMYGLWPSKETYLSCILKKRQPIILRPVLSWKTRIAQIKKVPQGAFIGYGCTYRTSRETSLAVLPVGYYDGYSRSLSNYSYVLIKGHRAPLRGRTCMNFIMADITDIPGVNLEDEVVLLGQDGEETITADYLANLAGTISYDIVTRINNSIPRIII